MPLRNFPSVVPLRRTAILLGAFYGIIVLNGCTLSDDPDDRAFFNRGWVNPRELDTDENFHRIDPKQKNRPQPPPNYVRDPLVD